MEKECLMVQGKEKEIMEQKGSRPKKRGRKREKKYKCFICGVKTDRALKEKYGGVCKKCSRIYPIAKKYAQKDQKERRDDIREDARKLYQKVMLDTAFSKGEDKASAVNIAKLVKYDMVYSLINFVKSDFLERL